MFKSISKMFQSFPEASTLLLKSSKAYFKKDRAIFSKKVLTFQHFLQIISSLLTMFNATSKF